MGESEVALLSGSFTFNLVLAGVAMGVGGYGVGVRLGVSSASLGIALSGFPCWSDYKLEDSREFRT